MSNLTAMCPNDGIWQCLAKPRHPCHGLRPHSLQEGLLSCTDSGPNHSAAARGEGRGQGPTWRNRAQSYATIWHHPPILLLKQACSSGCIFLNDLCPRRRQGALPQAVLNTRTDGLPGMAVMSSYSNRD